MTAIPCDHGDQPILQRVQIHHQIIKLLFGQRCRRHHLAASNNSLLNELIVGQQAARQVLLLIKAFQAGALHAFGSVSAVALRAVHAVNVASLRLLRVQSQFCIALLVQVFPAAGQNGQSGQKKRARQNRRFQSQVTIMFCTANF